jgi:hypothetical protein
MMKRMQLDQQMIELIEVPSVDEYSAKVERLGGKIQGSKDGNTRNEVSCNLY